MRSEFDVSVSDYDIREKWVASDISHICSRAQVTGHIGKEEHAVHMMCYPIDLINF